jgi:hypothetical protein
MLSTRYTHSATQQGIFHAAEKQKGQHNNTSYPILIKKRSIQSNAVKSLPM